MSDSPPSSLPSDPPAEPARSPRRSRLTPGKKLLFGLATAGVLLGVAEGVFRIREAMRSGRRETLSPRIPDTYRGLVLKPNVDYKAAGGQEMNVNALGMREKPVTAEREAWVKQRILAVGGSTTFGLYTSSNDKTWPSQVQRVLHERGYTHVEVLNGGVPAWDLRTSQTNLELRLYGLKPDVVICYHAYNDLVANRDPRYVRDSEADDVSELWHPLRASALYRFLRKRIQNPRKQLRTKAKALTDEGSAAFERNLRRFVTRTRAQGAKAFLCTYPSALRPTLAESEKDEVPGLPRWFGDLSPFEYPTLVGGLAHYNDLIRGVAKAEGVPTAELERGMPHDVKYYMSTVHHSDAGEVEVAKRVADALIEAKVVTKP
jgi:lysophospholipase L1-like esterase